MKTLELNLQKRILIMEIPENTEAYYKKEITYTISDQQSEFSLLPKGEYKLICKGSELKEGITKQLVHTEEVSDVEDYRHEKIYIDYNDEDNAFRCGFESFISALEAQGYYWGENPIKKPANYDVWAKYGDYTQYGIKLTEQCRPFFEAELKTFNLEKTLIFEILL